MGAEETGRNGSGGALSFVGDVKERRRCLCTTQSEGRR
jgi:hypothetical protein